MEPSRNISEVDFVSYPVSYSNPISLQRFLKIREHTVLTGLLACEKTKLVLNQQIVAKLPIVPTLDKRDARIFLLMASLSEIELNLISARITTFYHDEIVRKITEPEKVHKLLEWTKIKDVKDLLSGRSHAPFAGVPICPCAEVKYLAPVSKIFRSYLLGLLPPSHIQRMALALSSDIAKSAEPTSNKVASEALKEVVEFAFRLPVTEIAEIPVISE